MDLFGEALRRSPSFRGKGRLTKLWASTLFPDRREARLPGGERLSVDLRVPYERMVWLRAEEWDELRFLRKKLRQGQTFIDIGSNIGLWTLTAASVVGAAGRVISFEPNRQTYAKLLHNIAMNGVSWVEPINAAVSSGGGTALFDCLPEHNISAIVEKPSDTTVTIPTQALDMLSLDTLSGIKIDTEGHELQSLDGAARLIETFSPWLIIEFNTTLLPSRTLSDWAVYQYLAGVGYSPFSYDAHAEIPVSPQLESRGYRNILFQRL